MTNSFNKTSEAPSAGMDSPSKENPDFLKEVAKELKEAKDVGRNAFEALSDAESAESAETSGKVSETLGDVSDSDLGGALSGGTGVAIDPAKIRDQLLKNMPKEAVMRKQIEHEIKKEINYLHKKAMKMLRSPGEINYFEMSNMMKKIRELRGILMTLLRASVDTMKTLWLRYVHGVM